MSGDLLALGAVAALAAVGAARRGSQNGESRLDLKVKWSGKNLRVRYMGEKTELEGIGWVTSYGAVGGVNLESIPTIKLCADDLETMRASLPDVKVMIVTSAYLEEDLRGNGLGKKIYEVALAEAAKKGYAVAPEHCWHASMTSPDAKRVWASLKRRYFSVGDLVWGGRPPASHNLVDVQAQTFRVLMQRDREPFKRWLADYLDNDPEMIAQAEGFDYFSDYLSEARDLSVRDDGLLEADASLYEVDRDLVGGLSFALFHGTSTALLPSIRRQGLRPAYSQQQRSDKTYSTMAGVYVSTRYDVDVYANMAARQHGGDPVILTVRRTLDELEPDPDDAHLGWGTSAMQWITPYVPVSDVVEWS